MTATLFFGTEQGNTFFQGRDESLFFIARGAIVDGVHAVQIVVPTNCNKTVISWRFDTQ